jgi:hypothetical protein
MAVVPNPKAFPMRATLALVFLVAFPALAFAQYGRPARPEVKPVAVSASGKIKAVGPGVLQVVSAEGDQWQVAIAPKAEVIVTGKADPSFLSRGMLVKFGGKFNKKAESVDPLTSITVFTPRAAVENRREREIDPAQAEAAKRLFKLDEPMDPKQSAKPAETYDVSSAGAIVGARGGKFTVRAPEATFKIELADDAVVALDISDYRLARPGDTIELEGWAYPLDKTKILANKLTIRLAETVGEPKDKKEKEGAPAEEKPPE